MSGIGAQIDQIASLPMYDLPELRTVTDALWAWFSLRLHEAGMPVVDHLIRPAQLFSHWNDERLILSQTCGYPLLALPNRVSVVATPRYRAEGCSGAAYRSAIVVRLHDQAQTVADLRGRRCAVNDRASNSGTNMLRHRLASVADGRQFFSDVTSSGSHARSLEMIKADEADVAAIDCVTFALLDRYRPEARQGLRVLAWTEAAPGLPLITAAGPDFVAAFRRILKEAETDFECRTLLDALLIDGFEILPRSAYSVISDLESIAVELGYPVLR